MIRTLVILNAAAGTLRDLGEVDIDRRIVEPLERTGRTVEIVLARGKKIGEALRAAATGSHDEIIVGGGDGTVSRALNYLVPSGKTIGVLPLGTLNLLARDIGMPADLDGAVAALAGATARPIDLGRMNDRIFHSLSGLGFFSQIARAREEAQILQVGRIGRLIVAAWRAFTRSGRFHFHIEIDGKARAIDTYAFIVTVNRFDAPGWHRSRLDGGTFEVHVAHDRPALGRIRSALRRVKAAFDLMTGTWRDNPDIESVSATHVAISRGRPRAWVSTDGELVREKLPLAYALQPAAVRVLMPPRTPLQH